MLHVQLYIRLAFFGSRRPPAGPFLGAIDFARRGQRGDAEGERNTMVRFCHDQLDSLERAPGSVHLAGLVTDVPIT